MHRVPGAPAPLASVESCSTATACRQRSASAPACSRSRHCWPSWRRPRALTRWSRRAECVRSRSASRATSGEAAWFVHRSKEGETRNMNRLLLWCVIGATTASIGCSAPQQPDGKVPTAAEQISRAGTQPSAIGSAEWFTGRVRIEPLFPATGEINASAAYVTFAPGARSAWHTHPAGQRLVVTSGVGLTQEWSS
jgi:hypothetical protein